jgi:hypothetical protein
MTRTSRLPEGPRAPVGHALPSHAAGWYAAGTPGAVTVGAEQYGVNERLWMKLGTRWGRTGVSLWTACAQGCGQSWG